MTDSAERPSRPQMADLARLAKVSVSTVSRALSDHPRISRETRERIQELARSLHFTADAGAQTLRGKLPKVVAVAFPYHAEQRQHFRDPFFMAQIGAIGDALVDGGYSMLIEAVDAADFERVTRAYDTRQCVGTILLGQERHHDRINALALRGIPFVVWGARLPDQLYGSIGSDNAGGGRQATAHLLAGGARRIAFLGDPALAEVGQRHAGYRQAHADVGLAPDPALTLAIPFATGAARAAVEQLGTRQPEVDAVFAASDLLALEAIAALQARGRRVPQDVAVVGFDDIPAAAIATPALTTVHQDVELAGQLLVGRLFERIAGQPVASTALPTRLVVRASSRGG